MKLRVSASEPIWIWAVQRKVGAEWLLDLMPGTTTGTVLTLRGRPEAIAVSAVDRCGNASKPIVLEAARVPGTRPVPEPPR